jgi:hypothetical protein
MTDYNKINQWYAEQVGVRITEVSSDYLLYRNDETLWNEWTIKDPRCRQICREKYKIGVNYDGHKWWAESDGFVSLVFGDSIEEVELSCLVAIYEHRGE